MLGWTRKMLIVNGIVALMAMGVAMSWGCWSKELQFLLILMAIDYATGIFASFREGRLLESRIGFWGIVKKCMMLMTILIGYHVDLLLHTNVCLTGCVWFWIMNEMISVTENYGRMGLPIPEILSHSVNQLKNQGKENSR